MAITLLVKTAIIDNNADTSTAIAAALNASATYTTIYGFACIPISNTQSRLIVIYA